ncbi:hypothetical protein [Kitasatospora sp. GP82]|uniref:hypothetical protein n=1 Tax=Kitasatospora sp. GP82 TaxID=3035089 RepID=UPI0024743510|nr:hypothetical protein [Kitasatospora sp. GP82]MDH6127307.1 hypothetical protein [Kitasatospora sp. GP82]
MNHSILDGTPTETFADPGHAHTPGRALIRTCMSRPAVAVTPDTDFATTRTRSDAAALCLQLARIQGLTGLTDRLRWDVDDIEGRADP